MNRIELPQEKLTDRLDGSIFAVHQFLDILDELKNSSTQEKSVDKQIPAEKIVVLIQAWKKIGEASGLFHQLEEEHIIPSNPQQTAESSLTHLRQEVVRFEMHLKRLKSNPANRVLIRFIQKEYTDITKQLTQVLQVSAPAPSESLPPELTEPAQNPLVPAHTEEITIVAAHTPEQSPIPTSVEEEQKITLVDLEKISTGEQIRLMTEKTLDDLGGYPYIQEQRKKGVVILDGSLVARDVLQATCAVILPETISPEALNIYLALGQQGQILKTKTGELPELTGIKATEKSIAIGETQGDFWKFDLRLGSGGYGKIGSTFTYFRNEGEYEKKLISLAGPTPVETPPQPVTEADKPPEPSLPVTTPTPEPSVQELAAKPTESKVERPFTPLEQSFAQRFPDYPQLKIENGELKFDDSAVFAKEIMQGLGKTSKIFEIKFSNGKILILKVPASQEYTNIFQQEKKTMDTAGKSAPIHVFLNTDQSQGYRLSGASSSISFSLGMLMEFIPEEQSAMLALNFNEWGSPVIDSAKLREFGRAFRQYAESYFTAYHQGRTLLTDRKSADFRYVDTLVGDKTERNYKILDWGAVKNASGDLSQDIFHFRSLAQEMFTVGTGFNRDEKTVKKWINDEIEKLKTEGTLSQEIAFFLNLILLTYGYAQLKVLPEYKNVYDEMVSGNAEIGKTKKFNTFFDNVASLQTTDLLRKVT